MNELVTRKCKKGVTATKLAPHNGYIESRRLPSGRSGFMPSATPSHKKVITRLCRDMRMIILLNSRSHSTELATAAHFSQSLKLRLTVEKACCRNGT